MMQLIIRPAAEAEVQEASDWYEEREPGLGARFLDELPPTEAVAAALARVHADIASIDKTQP